MRGEGSLISTGYVWCAACAVTAAVAAVALALPSGGIALADQPSAGFKRVTAPQGKAIAGLDGFAGHVAALKAGRTGGLERFNHVVLHGSDGEVERIIVLGPKSAPAIKSPPVPRAKPGLPSYPERANGRLAVTFLKPGMRRLGWPLAGGGRLASGFGPRRHPVFGVHHAHSGVDLAAPRGTFVRAAANGVVRFVGRDGGYGRAVRIDHGLGLETVYAHLAAYAQGLARGTRVRQGEVIGRVGSSGRTTGPHLHYEVVINGTAVDPMSVSPPRLARR